jgi:hypothetical protein
MILGMLNYLMAFANLLFYFQHDDIYFLIIAAACCAVGIFSLMNDEE